MIRLDPCFFFFWGGGGGDYCMIEIAQMVLSYYLSKGKDCFRKHHGRNNPESAARARGVICRSVQRVQ